jgi:glycerol-3-phosphate acyltransferase PlsY
MMNFAAVILVGYLFGCFQTSYLLSRLIKKQDIRNLGNGNAGASNTTVVFGWKYGIVVAVIDILKATLSVAVIRFVFRNSFDGQSLYFLLYLNTLFVILGHNYPFYMNFKGGKGTASLIGAILAIDIRIAGICIIAIVFVSLICNYIALGTLSLVLTFALTTYLFDYSTGCLIIALLLALMSTMKHLVNFKNILKGTEHKVRKFF